ncbi:peptide-methionine (R)-S-oxide reductase [Aureococcus anophagefferens]|nr:peptide-methionine (R)-S-oxide reductase [Aureococcus anophagefferens]
MALPPSRSDGTPFPCQLSEEEYKAKLTGSQYRCLRQGGTEAYRRGEFCNFFPEDGYMACDRPRAACDIPLYSAKSKFADPGWDAYASCYWTGSTHLGHVFFRDPHSPAPTKERH